MINNPKISIITCSYNQGNFLEETIKSVLDQNYANLEYIIIDGGSTDNSVEIIKRYESRIKYWVSEKDNGQSHGINKGFKKATGEIIAWINSDDFYLPGVFNFVAEYFNEHKDVELIYGDILLTDVKGKNLITRKSVKYNFKMALYSECLIPQPTTFWRRCIMESVGELDEDLRYQMDYDYFTRMGYKRINIQNVRKAIAAFRLHAECKTVSEYNDKVSSANKIIKKKYSKMPFKNDRANDAYLKIQRIRYRFLHYIKRILTRGEGIIPYRATSIRKNIFAGKI